MADISDIYLILLVVSSLLAFTLVWYAWKMFLLQDKKNPAKLLSILFTFIGIWCVGSAAALWFTSEGLTYFFEQFKYIGIVFIPPTWLLLANAWEGKNREEHRIVLLLLYLIPFMFLLVIFTDSIHHLFWSQIVYKPLGSYLNTLVTHGPAWWMMWSYSYVLLFFGTVFFVKHAISLRNVYKKQATLFVLAALIPWILNIVYTIEFSIPLIGIDLTPISFVFSGLLIAIGFKQFHLMDLLPVSKESVFNNLQDPVIVFDANKRLIELNKSAEISFRLKGKQLVGKNVSEVFESYPTILHAFHQDHSRYSFEIQTDETPHQFFDVSFAKIRTHDQPQGYVLSFRDITERKKVTNALKESEQRFHGIFEGVNDAIFLHEIETGEIISTNQKACEMYGYCKEEFKNLTVKDLSAGDQSFTRNLFYFGMGNIRKGLHKSTEWHAKGKDGNTFWVELNPTILTIGKEEYLLVTVRDIDDKKKAELQLKESEEKFRTFTESASIALMIFMDDTWVYVNPFTEEMTGYSKEEMIGMPFWHFVHPDYKDMVIHRGKQRQKGKNPPSHYEIKIVTKQGDERWIDLRARNISYNQRRAVLVTASDITEQKQSAGVINTQLEAIKSSMDGVGILDVNQQYTYVNQAHVNAYGYDNPDEFIGNTWHMLYDEDELKRFNEEIMPEFQKHGMWRGEAIGKKKDGSRFNQEITLSGLDDGGLICVVRDITREKMVLKELQDAHEVLFSLNKDLERKVELRTEEVKELMKQKDDFINQLGHDLKTPLTPIMVLLPMLEKKAESEKDKELFEVITRNIYFMKELVTKTINLAKLNSDKVIFNIEPISLTDEIKNTISNNHILFENNNITVKNQVTDPYFVEADQIQLQELLNNLLTNAVKYSSEEGGSIFVDAIDQDDSFIQISIRDTGIGMDEEQIQQAFKEFYKADDSRHNLDSSGLGLNICKRIVEKHGGTIWVESPGKNKGSTFYFTLKKAKKPVESAMESTVLSS